MLEHEQSLYRWKIEQLVHGERYCLTIQKDHSEECRRAEFALKDVAERGKRFPDRVQFVFAQWLMLVARGLISRGLCWCHISGILRIPNYH